MNFDRYKRQIQLKQMGDAGQAALARSRVLVIGCGAIGSVVCDQLARAGAGVIHVVDRDVVDATNLHRQTLFDESDAAETKPKAIAAADRILRCNSSVEVVPHIIDVASDNILPLIKDARPALIVDGSDNAELRYLINEASVAAGLPWVYGACVGVEGRVMFIKPGETPCLRCIFPNMPSRGELATCDTAGVLGAIAGVVGSLQAGAAIRYLTGGDFERRLFSINAWDVAMRTIDLTESRNPDCPVCVNREFDQLHRPAREAITLCGTNTVQLRPASTQRIDLKALASRLSRFPGIQRTEYFLRVRADDGLQLTVFQDGRILVRGTEDFARARSAAAKVIGM